MSWIIESELEEELHISIIGGSLVFTVDGSVASMLK